MCLFLSATLRPAWTRRRHDDRSGIKIVFGFWLRSLMCYFEHSNPGYFANYGRRNNTVKSFLSKSKQAARHPSPDALRGSASPHGEPLPTHDLRNNIMITVVLD